MTGGEGLRTKRSMRLVDRVLPERAQVVCLSDVHGNPAALEAVLAAAPLKAAHTVVVHGDVVNRGPRSDLVWDRLFEAADERWIFSSGNHERYVRNHLDPSMPKPSRLMARVHQSSAFAATQLGARAQALFGWPDGVRLWAPSGQEARILHASMAGDDRGVSPQSPSQFQREAGAGPWSLLVVGHVHRPYDFRVDGTRILNAGSVGSSNDGVQAAGWIELEVGSAGFEARLQRVPYDVARTEADYRASGFLEGGGPLARLIYREWQLARALVQPWLRTELERVRAGEVDLDASVDAFLAERGGS